MTVAVVADGDDRYVRRDGVEPCVTGGSFRTVVADEQQLNVGIGAGAEKLCLCRRVHVAGHKRVIIADGGQHDHAAVLLSGAGLRIQAHGDAAGRDRLLRVHAHNGRMVRLRERENVAQRGLRDIRSGRDDQCAHRKPVHQAQHAVDMIVVRVREHEQVKAPVPLREQLARREVARIFRRRAAAAVHYGAGSPAGKHDTLPLTDIERRHGRCALQLHGIDGQHRAQCQHAARSGDPIAHLTPPGEQPRRAEHGIHQHEPPDDHAAAGEQHCTRKF